MFFKRKQKEIKFKSRYEQEKFEHGSINLNQGIKELIEDSEEYLLQDYIARCLNDHARGRWGTTSESQKSWNRHNIKFKHGKIVATYDIQGIPVRIETVLSIGKTFVTLDESKTENEE